MIKKLRILFLLNILMLVVSSGIFPVLAQDELPPPPPPTVTRPYSAEADDEKGSTVRGRVFYQDTGRPVRHGWVGFRKIRELVEPQKTDDDGVKLVTVRSGDGGDYGAEKYALTDERGEFVLKNIKSGVYQPVMKVAGILNPTSSDRENPEFQQIAVDGLSDIQSDVVVRRGAAISGRVFYADGEPIIGAKVQVFKKDSEAIREYSYGNLRDDITVEITDDRGFYRFSGLPAGEYIVRLTEQTRHDSSDEGVPNYNIDGFSANSELKTYYPNVSDKKKAGAVQAYLGQEQSGIDITVPDRRLFQVSGRVVAKNSKLPLKDIQVAFQKVEDGDQINYYNSNRELRSDEQGAWSFKELPAGKYRISLSQAPSYNYGSDGQPKPDNQPKYAPASREVEFTDKNLTDIVVELPVEATISGTFTVEGNKPLLEYVYFIAFDEEKKLQGVGYFSNRGKGENTSANQNGAQTFEISGLAEGNFLLSAQTDEYYVKSIRLGNQDLLTTPLQLKDGDQIKGVRVVLGTDVGTLKGRVANYQKGQLTFVVMTTPGKGVQDLFRNARQVMVSPNGQFEIKAAPGEYLVFVGTPNNRPDKDNLDEWYRELIKDAQRVTIRSNETTTITLNLPD